MEDFDRIKQLADDPDSVELAWYYHDAEYNPKSTRNEAKSRTQLELDQAALELNSTTSERAGSLIDLTTHQQVPEYLDAQIMTDLDLGIFGRSPEEFDEYEQAVRDEYGHVTELTFRQERAKILESFHARSKIFHTPVLAQAYEQQARQNLERSLRKLREKWLVYAGTFDPPTVGHQWMIETGSTIADHLTVAIGVNPDKKTTFSLDERLDMLRSSTSHLRNVDVSHFTNLYLVRYAEAIGAQFVLRGIRNGADFESERGMRQLNADFNPRVTQVFLMPPRELGEVSSSLVKGLVGPEGWQDVIKGFVSPGVYAKMLEKFSL